MTDLTAKGTGDEGQNTLVSSFVSEVSFVMN